MPKLNQEQIRFHVVIDEEERLSYLMVSMGLGQDSPEKVGSDWDVLRHLLLFVLAVDTVTMCPLKACCCGLFRWFPDNKLSRGHAIITVFR